MSIRFGDFRPSGRIARALDEAVPRLVSADSYLKIRELHFGERGEQGYTVTCDDECPVADAISMLEFDYRAIRRVEFLFESHELDTRIGLWLAASKVPGSTFVDGILYLQELIEGASDAEGVVRELVQLLVRLAVSMDAEFLNVSCEDDDALRLPDDETLLPSVCCICKDEVIAPIRDLLVVSGAVIERPEGVDRWIVWVAPLPVLLDTDEPTPVGVIELLRRRLSS